MEYIEYGNMAYIRWSVMSLFNQHAENQSFMCHLVGRRRIPSIDYGKFVEAHRWINIRGYLILH